MIELDTSLVERHLPGDTLEDALLRARPILAPCAVGEATRRDGLGWLRVNAWAGEAWLERIRMCARHLASHADTLVIIGVGGSNNAARAVIECLRPQGMRIAYAGNTLSAETLRRLLDALEDRDVALLCIAKNFETLEPGASFRLLRQWLVRRVGVPEAARRIACLGTRGSAFERLAEREGYAFVPFPEDVGGRFTALTGVHLLPLACAGIDVGAYVAGALEMERALRGPAFDSDPASLDAGSVSLEALGHPAFSYAVVRNLLWVRGWRIELLTFFEPRLRWFSKWWQQLFAESEGKEGKGLFPASAEFSEELHSLGQFVQDGTHIVFETLLDVRGRGPVDSLVLGGSDVDDGFGYLDGADFWDVNRASLEATRAAHAEVLPLMTLVVDETDAAHFGMLYYLFEFSCYLSARLLGVNPFDQPGVEAYKTRMFKALGREAR